MMTIENYNKIEQAPISYASKSTYTERVQNFVKYLHEFLPILKQEFEDLAEKAEVKPCKPFDDKMKGLSAIYNAEKDLYYWYIEKAKRQSV